MDDGNPIPSIPGYRIDRHVGSGGMGAVYRAQAEGREHTLALKLLHSADAAQSAALRAEFRLLTTLDHPALVRVHDFGYLDDGRAWYAMDWVDGQPIAPALLRDAEGTIDTARCAAIIADITAALEYIHSQHVLHGDIKPANILVETREGQPFVRLMDFGLSARRGDESGGLHGTIDYMPPELIRGEAASEGSDLYALGCVLFELLADRVPFQGENALSVLRMHLREAPPPLPQHVDSTIASWVRTLMEKEAPRRFRSAFQLHKAACDMLGRDVSVSARDGQRRLRLPDIPREMEQARATEIRNSARGGPAVLAVAGHEGAGVTRFLNAIAAEALCEGTRVLHLAVDVQGAPFRPLSRLLATQLERFGDEQHAALGILAAAAPKHFPSITPAVLPELSPEATRVRLFHAAAELLVAGGQPVVLVCDNAHALDDMTLEFLEFFVSFLEAHPEHAFLLLLGIDEAQAESLTELTASPLCQQVSLPPLPRAELAKALGALLGKISPSFVDVLHRQGQGLPGRVEELLAFCVEEGILEATEHGWLVHERDNLGAAFPAGLRQTFERAVARLDAQTLHVLTVLGAAAAPLGLDILSRVLEMDAGTLHHALARLEQRGLIAHGVDGYLPAHEALRETLPALDAATHARLFAWFSEHPPTVDAAAVLAHHAAGMGDDAAELPLLLRAADEREQRNDYLGALRCLQKALPLQQNDAEGRFATVRSLVRLCGILGRRDEEQELLEEMLLLAAQTNSPEKLASVYRSQTDYFIATGEYERARRSAERALGFYTQAGDSDGQAFCHRTLGIIEYRTRPGETVLTHYRAAQRLYADTGATVDEGNILVDIGLAYYSILEQPEQALACFEQARTLFERIDDPRGLTRVYGNMGLQYYALGKYEDALRHHQRANALAKSSGDRRLIAISCGSMGQCEIALCSYSPALLHLREELHIARELGDRYIIGKCHQNLGTLYLTLGAYDAAIEALTEANRVAVESDDPIGQASAANDLAMCHIERREFDLAQRQIDRAAQLVSEVHDTNVTAMLLYRHGLLLLARGGTGDAEKALELFGRYGDLADAQGFESHSIIARSYAAVAQTRLGRASAALELSEEAMQLLAAHGELEGGSRDMYLNHAQVLRANKSTAAALEAIETAHTELLRVAESISEPQLYRSFLEQVQVNAAIVRDFALSHRSDSPGSLVAIREQNLRTLYDVARNITSVLDLNVLLDTIMDSALRAMNGERGLIFLIEQDQLQLKVSRNVEKETISDATEISLSILRDVLHAGKPIIVSDTSQDEAFRNRESVVNFHIHSLICVPMRVRDEVIGTVYVDSRADAQAAMGFSEPDVEFLEAFAHLASIAIENARLHEQLKQENVYLRRAVQQRYGFENIIGSSAPMQRLFAETQAAIQSEGAVLISGESGTGKELIAKAIHYNGARKDKRFVAVDCGALPDTLLESELFGYKRGAFTGAIADKPGLFEEADHGTLFLDEISNTSLAFQAKLLRVLQEGEFRRVGDTKTRLADVRIICATNKVLLEEIAAGRFRQDLFYRLNVIPITVPPLRERVADVPELVQFFITRYAERHASPVRGISTDLVEWLQRQAWNGNVRELENLVNRMLAQAREETLTTRMLPADYVEMSAAQQRGAPGEFEVSLKGPQRLASLMDVEKEHINFVLRHTEGNKTEAARILGLKRTTLVERMKKLGMM